jgi:K+-sensing histidine kinase KdpD
MTAAASGELAALLDRVAGKARALARLAGLELSVSSMPGLRAPSGDAERIEQALLLLLMNALKQTPRGGRIALAASADPGGGLLIELHDAAPDADPPGLPAARYLVELGCGAATAWTVKRAQALLAQDCGAVGLVETPDRGATVTIRMPAERAAPAAA